MARHDNRHGYQRPQHLMPTVLRLMVYLTRYKLLLILVLFCLVPSSGCSVATTYLIKPILNDYIIPGNFSGLFRMLVLSGLLFALSAACSYAYSRIMIMIAQRSVAQLREDLFAKL